MCRRLMLSSCPPPPPGPGAAVPERSSRVEEDASEDSPGAPNVEGMEDSVETDELGDEWGNNGD